MMQKEKRAGVQNVVLQTEKVQIKSNPRSKSHNNVDWEIGNTSSAHERYVQEKGRKHLGLLSQPSC